jgi:protease-4
LRVNSPGGSALASDLVAEAMVKCAKVKPVIVSQGDVAASGGYWISMYGDEILAQPTTVTGSIGVIGGWFWDVGLAEKLGITSDFVKRGKHADLFTGPGFPLTPLRLPHRPLTDEEREIIMDEFKVAYQEFVKKVANGREMTAEDVETVAQGRVWTGDQGIEVGLIDAIGGLKSAIEIARVKAGIDPDDDVRILDYSSKGWFNFSGFSPSPVSVKWWGLWDRLFSPSEGFEQTAEDFYLDEFFDDYEFAYLWAMAKNNGRAMYLVPPDLLPAEARVGAAAQSSASFE